MGKININRHSIWMKFGGNCAYCGNDLEFKNMQIDHFLPKANFIHYFNPEKTYFILPDRLKHLTIKDVDHPDNLFPACRRCNTWKKDFRIDTFRSELEEQTTRLKRDSSNFRIALIYKQVVITKSKIEFYFEKELNKSV